MFNIRRFEFLAGVCIRLAYQDYSRLDVNSAKPRTRVGRAEAAPGLGIYPLEIPTGKAYYARVNFTG